MANKNKVDVKFEQPSDLLVFFNRYIVLIMAALIFIILILGYLFLLKPKMDSNTELQAASGKNIANQEASQRLLNDLEKLQSAYQNIQENRQADLDQLRKIIPSNPQIAELFVMVDKFAADKGLRVTSIDMAEDTEKTELNTKPTNTETEGESEEEGEAAAKPVDNAKTKPFKIMTLHFSVIKMSSGDFAALYPDRSLPFSDDQTDYELFKEYLTTLENNLRLMDIQTISLPLLGGGNDQPSFSFSVLTYYR